MTYLVPILLLSLYASSIQAAEEYSLIIQPIQSPDITKQSFQPLADFLSEKTGAKIKLVAARNFVSYWQTMRKGKYDLVLDAAHFTDWRIRKLKYVPLAKINSVVSFTLVTHTENPVLEASELIGKRVAVLSSPSMGAVRLAEFFPSPLRQPVIVNVSNSQEAVEKIQQGKTDAAISPTRMVGGFPFLTSIESTEQVPHMALSASPNVPADIRSKIKDALLEAKNNPQGRALLDELVLESFEPANSKMYRGYSKLLKGVFGY